jgi:WXXGXW repeat (2 copies)
LVQGTNIQGEKIMKLHLARHFCLFATLALIGAGFSFTLITAAKGVAYAEEGVEVLTHGPVHEAFAETVAFDSQEGMLVQKAPPEPIEELAPDQKPEGDNVEWIPGYWAWDDDINDYIWVSGVWRAMPPGREWVPGYWNRTTDGFQWVSGYWGKAGVDDTEYLPEPPATVESGPNVYAPSPDYGWIPGCWIWSGGRYAWRPGYWARMQPDWVWVPAHYGWTPRGYIFVGGYWDYVVPRRGILFAPVYFGLNLRIRHGFRYSPFMVINLDIFFDSLFLRPRYSHYYFGDYYDSRYYQRGFYPWFSPHAKRHGYDPIYAHQRWKHRNDRDWERHIQDNYRNRRDNIDARPSRRLLSASEMRSKGWKTKDGRDIVAKPLEYVSKNRDTSWRFKPVGKDERKLMDQREKDFRNYRQNRHDLEVKKADRPEVRSSKGFEPAKVKTPRSPIKSKSRDQFEEKTAPPNRYNAPKADPTVEPLKRKDVYDRRDSRNKDSERVWKTDDQRKKTDDRGIKADGRGIKTEDRERKAGDRGRKTEDTKDPRRVSP